MTNYKLTYLSGLVKRISKVIFILMLLFYLGILPYISIQSLSGLKPMHYLLIAAGTIVTIIGLVLPYDSTIDKLKSHDITDTNILSEYVISVCFGIEVINTLLIINSLFHLAVYYFSNTPWSTITYVMASLLILDITSLVIIPNQSSIEQFFESYNNTKK